MRLLLAAVLLLPACPSTTRLQPRAAEELRRGFRHLEAGDRERADVAFAHALAFHPELAEAWNGRGIVAEQSGDLALAARCFERAAAAQPDFAEARVNRGVVLARLGRLAEAEAAYRQALAIDPDLAVARLDLARALLHRGLAEPEQRAEHWAAARREYLHLLESREDEPAAWHDLGFLDLESGHPLRAEAEYRRAAELQPAAEAALHGLCLSLARLSRCAEAEAACRRCLAAAPGSASCRKSLAGAEACQGAPPGSSAPGPRGPGAP